MSAVGNLLDDLTQERDRARRERDESRREHLVTQEQLTIVGQHRDALAGQIESMLQQLEGFVNGR